MVLGQSLSPGAVDAIVRAAENGRAAVVPHLLAADDVACSEADLDLLAGEMPAAWVRGVDGSADRFGGYAPTELGHILPHHRDQPALARIYNLQRSQRHRPTVESIYSPLEKAWPTSEPWLKHDAGLFLGSAGSGTPAHSDQHHNLLLQLVGAKEVGVVTPGSRQHAVAVTRSFRGSMWVDEMPPGAETITLTAGSALYLPAYAIHWVRNLERTVAISCGWSTAATVRSGEVFAAKATLSRIGLPIQSRGSLSDRVSLGSANVVRRVRPGQ
jgi:hypothetical protein